MHLLPSITIGVQSPGPPRTEGKNQHQQAGLCLHTHATASMYKHIEIKMIFYFQSNASSWLLRDVLALTHSEYVKWEASTSGQALPATPHFPSLSG